MLTRTRIGAAVAVAMVGVLALASGAKALSRSDRPAAGVVFPRIDVDTLNGRDTVVRLSNMDPDNAVTAKCFYVNGNSHCTNTGEPCTLSSACLGAANSVGSCVPGWTVTDFLIVLTAQQPLGWRASEGLSGSSLPLHGPSKICSSSTAQFPKPCKDASDCRGGDSCDVNQTNAGTLIPPAPEDPFMGELKCVEIDRDTDAPPAEDGAPSTNDLKGEATIETIQEDDTIDVGTYNAVGLTSTGDNNGDTSLDIGNEYNACPQTLVVNHLFDGAINPITSPPPHGTTILLEESSTTELALVPCSEDLTGADRTVGVSTAQFLVYNEFEQRFSTSRRIDCFFKSQLSLIDTTQPEHSIWNAAVSGTVGGQTRVRGIGSGLLGAARLTMTEPENGVVGSAAYNVHQDGERTAGDTITIP
ncbi:MAG: hypothetical protein HYR72_05355 [Deltaproteobacteria bacterium]|nr:hypothetical protein [Deltaproteobacteria bacterium]MBI3389684.1 hypothetical protein [Deltaproteobacteria bacterium]